MVPRIDGHRVQGRAVVGAGTEVSGKDESLPQVIQFHHEPCIRRAAIDRTERIGWLHSAWSRRKTVRRLAGDNYIRGAIKRNSSRLYDRQISHLRRHWKIRGPEESRPASGKFRRESGLSPLTATAVGGISSRSDRQVQRRGNSRDNNFAGAIDGDRSRIRLADGCNASASADATRGVTSEIGGIQNMLQIRGELGDERIILPDGIVVPWRVRRIGSQRDRKITRPRAAAHVDVAGTVYSNPTSLGARSEGPHAAAQKSRRDDMRQSGIEDCDERRRAVGRRHHWRYGRGRHRETGGVGRSYDDQIALGIYDRRRNLVARSAPEIERCHDVALAIRLGRPETISSRSRNHHRNHKAVSGLVDGQRDRLVRGIRAEIMRLKA